MSLRPYIYLVSLALLVCGCERVVFDEEELLQTGADDAPAKDKLTVIVSRLAETPFSEHTADVCSRFNFAIYNRAGERLKQVNQKLGDSHYGTASFQLDEGDYQVVVIGHSSSKNPTMTNPAKIQFNNSIGYTETFLYHTTLTVDEAPLTLAAPLERIVSMCRFVINDQIPGKVQQIRFQYKGGSGHFNAVTGLGVTNSTQLVTHGATPGKAYTSYDLYTFLHDTKGTVRLTVTALDAGGSTICERQFDVPLQRNQITWLCGNFFPHPTSDTLWTVIPAIPFDHQWAGETYLTY